jgi:hypothetical protein
MGDMLIACTGADSYRSLTKARELEAAYRTKYDPSGLSVVRLDGGSAGTDALASRMTGASLFSSRRFIRIDDLIGACPKAKRAALIGALSRSVDDVIVVTVETGELKAADLKEYNLLPKFFQYDFPTLPPASFGAWCREHARVRGLDDASLVTVLIEKSCGNTWEFVNEIDKCRAGGMPAASELEAGSVYDVIESFFDQLPSRWSRMRRLDDTASLISIGVGQARSLALIQSGRRDGIHPYAAQQLSRMKRADASRAYRTFASSLIRSRYGISDEDESMSV